MKVKTEKTKALVIDKALAVQRVPLARLMTLIDQRTSYAECGDIEGVEYINTLIAQQLGL